MKSSDVVIDSMELYEYVLSRGHDPLSYNAIFPLLHMDINFRIEIQRKLFQKCNIGRADNVQRANSRFYHYCWENSDKICEECQRPLNNYSPVYISHIKTRGSHPEMAFDPRNVNILCYKHHNMWENGDKEKMRIYPRNMKVIEILEKEYNESKKGN